MTVTGTNLRDRGVDTALAADVAVHRMYREDVEAALERLARTGCRFTADGVRTKLPETVRERMSPVLLPAVFRTAARRGEIAAVGFAVSRRPHRHASVLRIWRGVAATPPSLHVA